MDNAHHVPADQVEALRGFSRFYTRQIGLLHEHLLDSRFTLPEARVLWELAQQPGQAGVSAATLARELQLDAGYLSRLLAGLKARGLLRSQVSATDARQTLLRLSAAGRKAFAPLDQRSQQRTAALLGALPPAQRQALVGSAGQLQALLQRADQALSQPRPPPGATPAAPPAPPAWRLRAHQSGDLGWVVARHGALYHAEYGWGLRFEALVAGLCARFVEQFDARREACLIAEWPAPEGESGAPGQPIGSVFLVQACDEAGTPEPGVAQLRMLLVEPAARGVGVGDGLVAECIRFAQAAGYQRLRLWTNDMLLAARRLYVRHGWQLVASEPHADFGIPMVGEIWERPLGGDGARAT